MKITFLLVFALVFLCGTDAFAAYNAYSFAAPGNIAITSPYPVLNIITPQMMGAKCDGTTDDATAFQNALNAVGQGAALGSALFLPASPAGCVVKSTLSYTVSSAGPLQIFGVGPKSRIIWENTSGGLNIIGSCGAAYEKIYMDNFSQEGGGSGTVAYGIQLNGIAAYGLDNVSTNSGSQLLTTSIVGLGAQQGYIHGGYAIQGANTDISLNNCTGGSGTVSSNGVDIGAGRTVAAFVTDVNIGGAASDVWIHNLHATGSAKIIIVNQSMASGPIYIDHNHFEVASTEDIDVQAGNVIESFDSDYSSAHAHVASGATLTLLNNTIDGTMLWDSGSNIVATGNQFNGAITNNAGCASVVSYLNTGNGNILGCRTHFNQGADFTSTAPSAGDILALKPNSLVSGNWGESITGAGSGDVYLKLNDVAVAGTTGGGVINLESAPGGTIWASATAAGLTSNIHYLNGGSTPSVGTCGTSPSITGTDGFGTFTTGTGSPAACTITFSVAYPNAAWCSISSANSAAVGITTYISTQTRSLFTVTLGSGTSSAAYNYTCGGK